MSMWRKSIRELDGRERRIFAVVMASAVLCSLAAGVYLIGPALVG